MEMDSETTFSKIKQISISCDVCKTGFQSLQALRVHKSAKHPNKPQIEIEHSSRSSDSFESTSNKSTPLSRTSKRIQMRKNGGISEQNENSDHSTEEQQNKVLFACPKCKKSFRMYFEALKHIEKKHPEDSVVTRSSGGSKLKPVRVETNINTNKLDVTRNKLSAVSAELSPDQSNNTLYCLGCDTEVPSISDFNKHAYNTHSDEVDSMFFKDVEEYQAWKLDMETQVKIKYVALTKSISQTYYICNYVSSKNEQDKTYLCPSLILVKELRNGTQIHYSKKHFGHTCTAYELPAIFSHLMTSKREPNSKPYQSITKKPDSKMVEKFQNLMSDISKQAMKLNTIHLKRLLTSAIQMQGLLNNFDEVNSDNDESLSSKSMTDVQITNALEGKRTSARLKRKSETRVSVDSKKKKDVSDTENSNKTGTKENKNSESPNATARSSPLLSPSFADSFKQFIDKPIPEPTKKGKHGKKEVVKTKIGQFSPKNKSREGNEDGKETKDKIEDNSQEVIEEQKPENAQDIKKPQEVNKETPEKTKRNILKPSKTNTSFSLGNGIKYEVKERENECNILILKM